jgi:hypothetical protein
MSWCQTSAWSLRETIARPAKLMELRYFEGGSGEETAEVPGVHPNMVIHDWALAKARLKRGLTRGAAADAGGGQEEDRGALSGGVGAAGGTAHGVSRAGLPECASADRGRVAAQTGLQFVSGRLARVAGGAGVRLGNFGLLERIGRGGMGEVWRARDARLKRDVAIKLLPVTFARDPERVARFEQQQSVRVEQETFDVGLGTNYLVIQYQTFLAQAQSTEVAAKGAYAKAKIALDPATARTLEVNQVIDAD